MKNNIVYKLTNINAVPCGISNENWLIDGEIVPVDRKPIDWEKCMKPMYTTKTITEKEYYEKRNIERATSKIR